MAKETIPMPKAGEMMEEGVVVEWLVAVGDEVAEDQPLVVISTDKVDMEVESPVSGTVTNLLAEEDQTVKVGEALLEVEIAQ